MIGVNRLYLAVLLAFAGAAEIIGANERGRLLTPHEGCGFQPPKDKFLMPHQKSWPWMGSVLAYSADNNKFFASKCTVSLISSQHVLTSAYCSMKELYVHFILKDLSALKDFLPIILGYGNAKGTSNLFKYLESFQGLYVRLGETPKIGDSHMFSIYAVARSVVHPKAKANELKNNLAILYLEKHVQFSDRIRPACLPLPQRDSITDRITDIYRLVRVDSFDVSEVAEYSPKKYTHVDPMICALIHKINLFDQTAFCAEGEDNSGNESDPFVMGENSTSPTYLVGLDVKHVKGRSGIFLDLHPYVQWINETISEKEEVLSAMKSM